MSDSNKLKIHKTNGSGTDHVRARSMPQVDGNLVATDRESQHGDIVYPPASYMTRVNQIHGGWFTLGANHDINEYLPVRGDLSADTAAAVLLTVAGAGCGVRCRRHLSHTHSTMFRSMISLFCCGSHAAGAGHLRLRQINGAMDELRIWSVALPDSSFDGASAMSGLTCQDPSNDPLFGQLMHHFKFDELAGGSTVASQAFGGLRPEFGAAVVNSVAGRPTGYLVGNVKRIEHHLCEAQGCTDADAINGPQPGNEDHSCIYDWRHGAVQTTHPDHTAGHISVEGIRIGGPWLPTNAVTVECWINLDSVQEWAGCISFAQVCQHTNDDGCATHARTHEHKWMPGYAQNRRSGSIMACAAVILLGSLSDCAVVDYWLLAGRRHQRVWRDHVAARSIRRHSAAVSRHFHGRCNQHQR